MLNTGLSSNDPLSEPGSDTRRTSLEEEEQTVNLPQTEAKNPPQIPINDPAQRGTDNIGSCGGTHNSVQGEVADNPPQDGGTQNPSDGEEVNLPQGGGNNAIQEGGNNAVQEGESSTSTGIAKTSSNPVSIPERIDTSDPQTRHLTRGVPEEPSVLNKTIGEVDNNRSQTVNADELEEIKVKENRTNQIEEVEHSGNGNSSDLNKEAESNREGNETSSNADE
jgi:hypothetical protein